jgi:ribosomal protein S18 acetylase RimI-like enzyme
MAACPPRALAIRTAGREDLLAAAQLLDQAGEWMRSQGITDQWPIRFPLSDLAQRADRGEIHIAYDGTMPVGTFALDWTADPEFWHDHAADTDAGYLHRLAVARSHAGQGIGAQLAEHAANLVARNGRRLLRLDCAKHNTRLHEYYRQLGFTHVRTIDLAHRKSGALFERRVGGP